MKILICWLGKTDINACGGKPNAGDGPIRQAVQAENYELIVLLSDWGSSVTDQYSSWLKDLAKAPIEEKLYQLSGPTEYREIYEAADAELAALKATYGNKLDLTIHLSPGTPQMATVWIILAKTRYSARLIESSIQKGVREAFVPFDISAEYLPSVLKRAGEQLIGLATELPDSSADFAAIVHKSAEMKRSIAQATRVAPYPIPVLIEGESGTGKELMAHAIHHASGRTGKIVSVNCGAIPAELVESEFFGHIKGAFSGASSDRKGHFEEAHDGTLFLDEIGELPKSVQVKLLRALQENRVVRVGSSTEIHIDVRVITATNRRLVNEVAQGNFREDLYYRLAVGMIRLAPLRERRGDLGLLIEHLLEKANQGASEAIGQTKRTLSPRAKNVLLGHSWPGNVRELFNTLLRAVVWSDYEAIDADVIQSAIFAAPMEISNGDGVLNRQIGDGISLDDILAGVARHYIERALSHTQGNKTQAAKLLSFNSYQRLDDWRKRYGIAG